MVLGPDSENSVAMTKVEGSRIEELAGGFKMESTIKKAPDVITKRVVMAKVDKVYASKVGTAQKARIAMTKVARAISKRKRWIYFLANF